MKQAILSCALLLATASMASAAGLNLRWADCAGDGGIQNITFACNTNTGNRSLVGSFVLDADLPMVIGNELVVDLQSVSETLPDWWRFWAAGVCRQTALTIAAHSGTNCPDMFESAASMNIFAYEVGRIAPNRARLKCVDAVQAAGAVTLYAGQEYGIAKWTITNSKTVGSPSCAGCCTPVDIVFHAAHIVTDSGLDNTVLMEATSPGSNHVTWQAGAEADCQPVPTRNSTWGAVKSLYR